MTFTRLARIATYISLAAPLIAARFLFFPFVTGKILFFRVFTELAGLALVGAVVYGEIPIDRLKKALKKPLFIVISIFITLFALSAITAQIPSFAFWSNFERGEGAWQMLHYFLFFFIISTLFQTKEDWRRLVGAQSIIAALVALYAVGQAINWPSWIIDPPTGRVSGTLGNPAYIGIYMAISSCLTIWLAAEDKKRRFLWILIAIFEAIIFLVAQNRGSFAGVGAGIIFMFFLQSMQKERDKKSLAILYIAYATIICVAGALIFTVKGGNAIQDLQPRLWTWESAITGVIERPITGWGAENFPFIFDRYYNPKHYLVESWFDRAHNTPLEYLTIGGIPLFIAYGGIFAVLYARLLRKKKGGLMPLLAGVPLMYVVNGLVLFETIPLYIILFISLGLINAFTDDFIPTTNNLRRGIPRTTESSIFFGGITIITLISLYTTSYIPLKKNIAILESMRTDGKTDTEVFQMHDQVLLYTSPVGNQESLQGLLTFTVSYFDYLRANKLSTQIPKEKIKEIMNLNAHWYDRVGPYTPGLKLAYIRATGLLAAYQHTKDADYLKEADQIIAESAALSPTRIEFVRLAMASAALRNDKPAYEAAVKKGRTLLPNLTWEPEMKKFIY